MLDCRVKRDPKTGEKYMETSLTGKPLLTTPQLNKGTAFTAEERRDFALTGKLPPHIETLDEQIKRCRIQFQMYHDNLSKHVYLSELHDRNQVLFYRFVGDHLSEMLPIIYTPIVGSAVKQFSHEFRQARGLYLSYPDKDRIGEILDNRSNPDVDLIVVTDGEGVLGIGDQGVGGMDIPVAKLMVYALCGGISPLRTLPILLDVGTNNETLLSDPLYLGWRNKRLSGQVYDEFIETFVDALHDRFPNFFLHWEDFGRDNARRNLERFQDKMCTFNDDMQGTGVVTVSAILAAVEANKSTLGEQRIVVFGAGTAGTGIADQICQAIVHHGVPEAKARKQFWLLDRPGLLLDSMWSLNQWQINYARDHNEVAKWGVDITKPIDLLTVIKNVKPTILIGTSAQADAFNEEVVKTMASFVEKPIILPLSNPVEKAEATPYDLLNWTDGKALIATGSPFDHVIIKYRAYHVAQCNNALVFPGIGLGVLSVKAQRLTENMLWAACETLSECAPIHKEPHGPILPYIEQAPAAAQKIALAVAQQAIKDGVTDLPANTDLKALIEENFWSPEYIPLRRI